jgi:hypothetical protein
MIEVLGWTSTVLVLLGYVLNAKMRYQAAMIVWIVGDIGWITYDFFITNISHLVLSVVIISINLYGIYQHKMAKKDKVSQSKAYL